MITVFMFFVVLWLIFDLKTQIEKSGALERLGECLKAEQSNITNFDNRLTRIEISLTQEPVATATMGEILIKRKYY